MHVFYHKNKFALSGRAEDVLRFIRSMGCESGTTLRAALADRTISCRIHSYVLRDAELLNLPDLPDQSHPDRQ